MGNNRIILISKYLCIGMVLLIIFVALLVLAILVPNDAVKNNVEQSAEILSNSEPIDYYNNLDKKIFNHNHSDALMINIMYGMDKNNIIESIVKCKRNNVIGLTQKNIPDSNGDLLHNGMFDMTQELLAMTKGENQTTYDYARYWHGYIAVLKPLFLIFNIQQIRIILALLVYLLLGLLCFILYKNNKLKYGILIILAFIMSDLFNYWREIQGIFVIIVALIESVLIASRKIKKNNLFISLFVTGAVTQYLDFLTTPIITLLLPIIVYFIINDDEEEKINRKEIIKTIMLSCLTWGIGYVVLWFMKWILADLLLNIGLLEISLKQIMIRTIGTKNDDIIIASKTNNVFDGLVINLEFFITLTNMILLIFAFVLNILIKDKDNNKKIVFASGVCSILIIVYYLIMSQHTFQHYFFTFRSLMILYLFLLIITLGKIKFKFNIKRIQKKRKKK